MNNNSGSSSGVAVRGAARALHSALRGAARSTDSGEAMDLDGGVGRSGRRRGNARSAGPLDQSGRHRHAKETPYAKPTAAAKALSSRITGPAPKRGPTNLNPRRNPEGTPDVLKDRNANRARIHKQQHSKINETLKGEEIKQWIRSRNPTPGVLDMSNLLDDPWLKEQGILPPGHDDAPPSAGHVLWKLSSTVLETPGNYIHTLTLANNGFRTLSQLARLPLALPHIRALDLSNNPIVAKEELRHLQSAGEQKGKASTGAGSLKSLVELKLNGVRFREKMLEEPDGGEQYQHDILRRFPGLLILDGVQLNRIIFPVERKPVVRRNDSERKTLAARPFTFPFDIAPQFEENDECRTAVMNFCQMFFTLYDSNRSEVIHGYHPEATISIAANTLPSRSYQAQDVNRSRSTRPAPVSFEAWVSLPGRNFLRSCTTINQRVQTLKSPMDSEELLRWLNKKVPKTQHPLDDPSKWCIDAWYFDTNNERISAVIQGEFQEMPSGSYRSFTRTFILGATPPGSTAASRGWPCVVLSDMMIVHSYLGTASFDNRRSMAVGEISISAPSAAAVIVPNTTNVTTTNTNEADQRAALIEACRQRTGMNAYYSELCLSQNGWDLEAAVANFTLIRASIPADAFA